MTGFRDVAIVRRLMKNATTIQNTMPKCSGVVVALRNRRGFWFSIVKTSEQEEII